MQPFETVWVRQVRFGVLAAVSLPSGTEPVPADVLQRLHPREAALAQEERGRRQIERAGGRLAFREALKVLGHHAEAPLVTTSSRAPVAPAGLTVSITHKDDLALALVSTIDAGHVGVDLEGGSRDRSAISSKVCRPEELAEVERLSESERWPNVMVRFAVKEAVYKAIAPQLGRFFGFQAARVDLEQRDRAQVTLFLDDAPAYSLDTELLWLGDHVVAMVRAKSAG